MNPTRRRSKSTSRKRGKSTRLIRKSSTILLVASILFTLLAIGLAAQIYQHALVVLKGSWKGIEIKKAELIAEGEYYYNAKPVKAVKLTGVATWVNLPLPSPTDKPTHVYFLRAVGSLPCKVSEPIDWADVVYHPVSRWENIYYTYEIGWGKSKTIKLSKGESKTFTVILPVVSYSHYHRRDVCWFDRVNKDVIHCSLWVQYCTHATAVVEKGSKLLAKVWFGHRREQYVTNLETCEFKCAFCDRGTIRVTIKQIQQQATTQSSRSPLSAVPTKFVRRNFKMIHLDMLPGVAIVEGDKIYLQTSEKRYLLNFKTPAAASIKEQIAESGKTVIAVSGYLNTSSSTIDVFGARCLKYCLGGLSTPELPVRYFEENITAVTEGGTVEVDQATIQQYQQFKQNPSKISVQVTPRPKTLIDILMEWVDRLFDILFGWMVR